MLFDLLTSLVGNVDVMCGDIKMLDVNGDTLQKKLDVTSKEIKLAVKHATDRVDKVMEKVVSLEHGLKQMKEKVDGFEEEIKEVKEKVQASLTTSSLVSELDEIQKKKNNLCIYGLKESECLLVKERVMEETSLVSKLLKETQLNYLSPVPLFKIWNRAGPKIANKTRPLIVEIPDEEARKHILANLNRLRDKPEWQSVSIAMDRTRMQRENDKKVYNELKAKKDKANQEMSEEEKNGFQYVILGQPGM